MGIINIHCDSAVPYMCNKLLEENDEKEEMKKEQRVRHCPKTPSGI